MIHSNRAKISSVIVPKLLISFPPGVRGMRVCSGDAGEAWLPRPCLFADNL
jgi:hypothetical protein